MSQVRAVADYGDLCGEGPTWDPDSGWLYWTDIEGHRFFRYHQASDKHEIVKQGLEIAGYSLNRPGGVLVANSRGIWLWDGADGLRLIVDQVANSDRELEQRGHRFVRYADDCNIYVRSPRAGQRVMASVTRYITRRLKLKMNESKSAVARPAVARPEERKFLGFSFTGRPSPKRCLAPKAKQRFKERIRELTRPGTGSEPAALLSRNEPLRNDEAKAFRQTAAHHALVSQSKGANKALNGLRSVDAMQGGEHQVTGLARPRLTRASEQARRIKAAASCRTPSRPRRRVGRPLPCTSSCELAAHRQQEQGDQRGSEEHFQGRKQAAPPQE